MRTFYAVFDTNVLVSALMSKRADSPTVLLLDYVLDGRIVLLYNEDIIREYKEVLHRSKFDFSEDSIHDLIELVKTGLFLDPTESGETFPDIDDRVFYEVALSKEDGYVVTGNTKHFPKSPIVVTPAEMMQIVQETNK
ncbi:MAG: putative toxin-antitoxin system toxin component, PIN family [Paludibacteraceae bacterium]|jgi:putative PIN family toxin of toxin-antitoxin system|nr:putative toxin-antitoxin system toxin component, PIN family [Paludibacteraceae bacterium]